MGILLAITALLAWGLGDFLIQRSTRKFGDWIALFYITVFGAVILFPFAYHDIKASFTLHAPLLWLAALVILAAALFDFEAMRVGKISVIEPVMALEIPAVTILAALAIHEQLNFSQLLLVIGIMLGIFLASTKSAERFKNISTEKGVWLAICGAVCMGTSNFLFGIGSRATNPIVVNWFTDTFLALVCFGYLATHSRLKDIAADWKGNKRLIVNVSFFDKLAWVAFSYSMLYIPIAVATGISEGYVAFAGVLGLTINREKLKRHQWIGFAVTVISVILLALVTDR